MKRVSVLLVIIFLCLNMISCNTVKENNQEEKGNEKNNLEQTWDLTLGCDSYLSSMAQTYLLKNIIEQKGYEVEVKIKPQQQLYNDLTNNIVQAIDYPVISNNIMMNQKINDLGANFSSYKKGLIVPNYVSVAEISELRMYKKKFNDTIYTFDNIVLLKTLADTVNKSYGLNMKVEVKDDSEMDQLIDNYIKNKKWFVIAGYTPHWLLKKYDLRYLEDTMFVFEDKKESHTLVNKVLETKNKEIYNILNSFYLYDWELNDLLFQINRNGYEQFYYSIQNWLNENQYVKDRCCES